MTAAVLCGHAHAATAGARRTTISTAFFYGARVPRELAQHFDRLVVDTDNLQVWPAPCRAELFAYVSVGEVDPGRPWRRTVPDEVFLGHNREWGSEIVDVRRPAWRAFVLEKLVPGVLKKGIRGLFLDTLDSFESVEPENQWPSHQRALAELVDAIRNRHPGIRILFNRGFRVLPFLATRPDGVVAESLFRTADATGKNFRPVAPEETAGLLAELRAIQKARIPVTVIDYVPAKDRDLRRATAKRIIDEGFEPYISVPSLDQVGMGRVEPARRRVMLLFRSHPGFENMAPPTAPLAAPVLEWLGYAVDYVDVRRGLPKGPLTDRYAGAVVLGEGELGLSFSSWIQERMDDGLRVAFLNDFGFVAGTDFAARLGLAPAPRNATAPLVATLVAPSIGFDGTLRPLLYELPPFRVVEGSGTRSLLRLGDKNGEVWDAIVVGTWGGVVFAPYLQAFAIDDEPRWTVNLFAFLREALSLARIPAPDVTTEAGNRILTVHLDGDGFPSRAESGNHEFAGQIVLDEFLRRYPVPHTVSVIEGEVGPSGLYPRDSPRLEEIARAIYRLEHVEGASHTFSHPFIWSDVEAHRRTGAATSLPIPSYVFDPRREIAGSLEYVDRRLMPPGRRSRVLLWSGDCSPSAEMVALAEQAGVENVNGGGATMTLDRRTVALASPLGMNKGGSYQVFAPIQNENVFTNDWHGPFYGYQRAIETFELTESPRRLHPISIYYHFFSATKTASRNALHKVYAWALKQRTTKLFLSEYAKRVRSFYDATLALRWEDDAWDLGDLGAVQTVRLDDESGLWPALDFSPGVAGVVAGPSGRYVHLAADQAAEMVLTKRSPLGPYLKEANGSVLSWSREQKKVRLRIRGHEPIRMVIAGARRCELRLAGRVMRGEAGVQGIRFLLPDHDTGEATLGCS